MGGGVGTCRNSSTASSPHLKLPSEQERRSVHRRHLRDLLDPCQLQRPLRAGYEAGAAPRAGTMKEGVREAVALGRGPRAWQKPLRPASDLRRSTVVARARRRRLCWRWWKARPAS